MTANFSNDLGNGFVQADGFVGSPGLDPANVNNPTYGPMNLPAGYLANVGGPVTAHAGGGKANALVLPAQISLVGTVATAADSVLAPYAATVGRAFQVTNNAATNAMQLFGQGTDTINGVATGTGVSIVAGRTANLFCFVAGAWVGPIGQT